MRINEGEAIPPLGIPQRHSLDQTRLAGASFADDVHVQEPVFRFDPEDAVVIPKVDAGKTNEITGHIPPMVSLPVPRD
ncbi:hypothetical protein [Bradyrhizobium japonicum]|uniref:hypothetical protein n=1 Tax=Bradyrhizobium japonicum TaxID=375 RepID=UPI0004042398|nr:hypothetical protein [Bradyrhizobium japonicum]WLB97083.1 hypothetical protein QIH92_47650 [Bradyrhizobium japonicum USDA 123]